MSFTDQKPFLVTKQLLEAFKRKRRPWCCALCGHLFAEGETARWLFSNRRCGNFFFCQPCNQGSNEEILTKAEASFTNAVALARQWDIYGPDWQKDWTHEIQN